MRLCSMIGAAALLAGCAPQPAPKPAAETKPAYYRVDPASAGRVTGRVEIQGPRIPLRRIDMSQDEECVVIGQGRTEEPVLANVFVYIKQGLEGKQFAPAEGKVTIDQKGCWFGPRVLGIRPGQILRVTNSDPVSHNIHPKPELSREWNQNQPPESAALERRFLKPEVMIPVRCNIHRWMQAWIGVVDHPYFAVTQADGKFELRDVPPGSYVLEAWHEQFGRQERAFTLAPSGSVELAFQYPRN